MSPSSSREPEGPHEPSSARASLAWIVLAHTIGGIAIGALEAARLGGASLAMVLVPLFAATGVIAGAIIAGITRLVSDRGSWLVAFALAAPSLLVMVPVSRTLFQGAYAQTLPMAGVLPFALPLVLWLAIAVVIAGGRRLMRATDLTTRSIALLGCAGALGAIVWAERHVLKTGYPHAHIAATLAIVVLAGCAVRVAWPGRISPIIAAVIAALSLGTAIAATLEGLSSARDRQVVVDRGDQGYDLVRLVRMLRDADGDGSSPLLGRIDCDDHDPRRYGGAVDIVGDGIDQDCNGADATPPPAPPAPPPPADLASWRAAQPVKDLLARTKTMNVLFITVDALRFDMLAPGTVDRAEFPNLVRLLDESVWFTRAIAPAAGTDVSLGTILTGRVDPFQEIEWTLPEAMQNLGRRTASALPAEVDRYVGETLLRRGIDKARTVHTDWSPTTWAIT